MSTPTGYGYCYKYLSVSLDLSLLLLLLKFLIYSYKRLEISFSLFGQSWNGYKFWRNIYVLSQWLVWYQTDFLMQFRTCRCEYFEKICKYGINNIWEDITQLFGFCSSSKQYKSSETCRNFQKDLKSFAD